MELKATDFVIALADFLAGIAPALKRQAPAIQLFAVEANDRDADSCYSVLSDYDGNEQTYLPIRHLAIQCETLAMPTESSGGAVIAKRRAEVIHARLTTDKGPLREQLINGFVIKAIRKLSPPRLIRVEANGLARVSFNFDAEFFPNANT